MFEKKFNKIRFFLNPFFIKVLKNKQKVFKVKTLFCIFFLLKSKITFDFALNYINKSFIIAIFILKNSFKYYLK